MDETKTPRTLFSVFFYGLPERIRTFDLQSRSLTRYPTVPRAEINYGILFSESRFANDTSEFAARGEKSNNVPQSRKRNKAMLARQYTAKRYAVSLTRYPAGPRAEKHKLCFACIFYHFVEILSTAFYKPLDFSSGLYIIHTVYSMALRI